MPNASNCEHPEIHEQKRSLLDYKGTMSAFFQTCQFKSSAHNKDHAIERTNILNKTIDYAICSSAKKTKLDIMYDYV